MMRVAVPLVAGSTQMLPWRSMASRRPSGETATDIDVPSDTGTSMGAGGCRRRAWLARVPANSRARWC
ncbi:MAG: hypothetical protein R2708_15205 [Vicinamibacterales bacterium]